MPKRKRPTDERTAEKGKPKQDDEPTQEDGESGIEHFEVSSDLVKTPIVCERYRPQDNDEHAPPSLIFTHGAGGGITAAAVRDFALGFGAREPVVCFQGTMNLKNRVKAFRAVVENQAKGQSKMVLGGRSMGARAAAITALELDEDERPEALVLVSWPLTAGKEGKREPERREQILKDLPEETDVLFVVGDRDAQCDLKMLEEVRGEMKATSWLLVVEGADHGMSVREKTAVQPVRVKTGELAADWLKARDREKRHCGMGWDQESGEPWNSEWNSGDGE